MSSGERPIGAAKGKQSDTEALCQPPEFLTDDGGWFVAGPVPIAPPPPTPAVVLLPIRIAPSPAGAGTRGGGGGLPGMHLNTSIDLAPTLNPFPPPLLSASCPLRAPLGPPVPCSLCHINSGFPFQVKFQSSPAITTRCAALRVLGGGGACAHARADTCGHAGVGGSPICNFGGGRSIETSKSGAGAFAGAQVTGTINRSRVNSGTIFRGS